MKKEDFKNPFEWVMYKVNGRLPTEKLDGNTFPNGKYGVKYYKNPNGRYTAMYRSHYLCMCSYEDIPKIQEKFDEEFNGKNIVKISNKLKKEYNQQIIKRRGAKPKPYSKNRLNFQKKENGRMCARVSDKGKTHTICQCYERQRKEVSDKYDVLKKEHDLDTIKQIMKKEYNLIGQGAKKNNSKNNQIKITQNGKIYKNDVLITIDPKIYDLIENYIR